MNTINVDAVYMCHWDKLTERKTYLDTVFDTLGIKDIRWVTSYDKNNWDISQIEKVYPRVFGLNPSGRNLKYSEVSLVLKHMDIIRDAYNKQHKSVLVLEDDVLFHEDFINNFNLYSSQLPEDYDMCFIGSCCNLHAPYTPGKHVYPASGSRCTHAYMFSYKFAKTVIDEIKNVNDGADFYYNHLITIFGLKNYWFEPSLVSQNESFGTTIQNNDYK